MSYSPIWIDPLWGTTLSRVQWALVGVGGRWWLLVVGFPCDGDVTSVAQVMEVTWNVGNPVTSNCPCPLPTQEPTKSPPRAHLPALLLQSCPIAFSFLIYIFSPLESISCFYILPNILFPLFYLLLNPGSHPPQRPLLTDHLQPTSLKTPPMRLQHRIALSHNLRQHATPVASLHLLANCHPTYQMLL